MYNVGQVIFILRELKIVPVRVVEQNVKNTMSGKEITYVIETPDKKVFDMSKVKGKVYTALVDAKRDMISNANNAINEMISRAHQRASAAFGIADDLFEEAAEDIFEEEPMHAHETKQIKSGKEIELSDGTKARVTLSEETKRALGQA